MEWIDIFRAGCYEGKGCFSEEDIDQIIANFTPGTVPIVIGHPKENDPAWGWGAELKREGDTLYARFKDVDPTFAQWVEEGHHRNRSIKIALTDKGWTRFHPS